MLRSLRPQRRSLDQLNSSPSIELKVLSRLNKRQPLIPMQKHLKSIKIVKSKGHKERGNPEEINSNSKNNSLNTNLRLPRPMRDSIRRLKLLCLMVKQQKEEKHRSVRGAINE